MKNDEGFERSADTYGESQRDTGMGPYRIDKPLGGGLRDDLYSMIFASTFHPEYILHYREKIKVREELMD